MYFPLANVLWIQLRYFLCFFFVSCFFSFLLAARLAFTRESNLHKRRIRCPFFRPEKQNILKPFNVVPFRDPKKGEGICYSVFEWSVCTNNQYGDERTVVVHNMDEAPDWEGVGGYWLLSLWRYAWHTTRNEWDLVNLGYVRQMPMFVNTLCNLWYRGIRINFFFFFGWHPARGGFFYALIFKYCNIVRLDMHVIENEMWTESWESHVKHLNSSFWTEYVRLMWTWTGMVTGWDRHYLPLNYVVAVGRSVAVIVVSFIISWPISTLGLPSCLCVPFQPLEAKRLP